MKDASVGMRREDGRLSSRRSVTTGVREGAHGESQGESPTGSGSQPGGAKDKFISTGTEVIRHCVRVDGRTRG